MARISLELDAQLNKQLKQYMTDRFGFTHGKQQEVIREALRAFLNAGKGAADVAVEKDLANEPVEAMSRSKPKQKTAPRTKRALTDADHAYMEEQWKAGKGWTEIGKGLNPARRPTVVKAAIESRIKKGELSEADRKK